VDRRLLRNPPGIESGGRDLEASPKMGALVEKLLEREFFIPPSKFKFKMKVYLKRLLELLL
jgi:hypothetical protein